MRAQQELSGPLRRGGGSPELKADIIQASEPQTAQFSSLVSL